MTTVLSYMPGQTVTVIQQVFNSDGYRADGYAAPAVSRIIVPGYTLATGNYPVSMTRLDVGLYVYSFTLPSGATTVGSYFVDIFWYHPSTNLLQQNIIQINVTAPFGIYSVTVPSPQ